VVAVSLIMILLALISATIVGEIATNPLIFLI